MRQSTYLNVILTVIAGLLSAVLWTNVMGRPVLEHEAWAQSPGAPEPTTGIPNASDQRNRMIAALNDMKATMEAQRRFVESGKLKVEVSNIDKLKTDTKTEKKTP